MCHKCQYLSHRNYDLSSFLLVLKVFCNDLNFKISLFVFSFFDITIAVYLVILDRLYY